MDLGNIPRRHSNGIVVQVTSHPAKNQASDNGSDVPKHQEQSQDSAWGQQVHEQTGNHKVNQSQDSVWGPQESVQTGSQEVQPSPFGNSRDAVGNHSVIRFFGARLGYGQLTIAHNFISSRGKQYQFATTSLSVLHSDIDDNFYGHANKNPGSDERNPHVTKWYAQLGLHLSKQDLEGIVLDDVQVYQMSVIVEGKGLKHAIDPEVMAKMKTMRLSGHEEAVEAVSNMFSKRQKTRFTFFCPGFDDQCARELLTFSESRLRTEDDPYGGMFNKVPSTMYFTNLNQLADLTEVRAEVRENAVTYFENIGEFTARFSYGSRNEHILSEAISALLETRDQMGIYTRIPYAQIDGRDVAGLIGLPKPTRVNALPRMDETAPESKPNASEQIHWLAKTLANFWQEAKNNGEDQKGKKAYFREKIQEIMRPAQKVEQIKDRERYLDAWAAHLMPTFKDNQRESPADHRARLENYAAQAVKLFQTNEAPRVIGRRIAVPPWLANWASHWYYVLNPRQRNWPKDSPVERPLVDIHWPLFPAEKCQHYTNQQVQKALATKAFPLKIVRTCHDDTVVAQLGGIAIATSEHGKETSFGNYVDFFPVAEHIRDRIAGKYFQSCAYASTGNRRHRKAAPVESALEAHKVSTQGAPGIEADVVEPVPRKLQDFAAGGIQSLARSLSQFVRRAETGLPEEGHAVRNSALQWLPRIRQISCGIDLGIDHAMQSTTIDENRLKELVTKSQSKSKKSTPDKLAHDTTEAELAEHFKLSTDDAKALKENLSKLELMIINQSDVILGTPAALSKLSRRKGLAIFVCCIFIDEAYRMSEPNTWAVLSAFKDAPFRIMAGDLKQLGPLDLRGSVFNFDLIDSKETETGSSFVNFMHARYIAEIVFRLHYQNAPGLLDRKLGHGKRATILIAAFYSEQVQVIINELARLPKQVCWKDGIKVTTVDGAQGDEADIVIIDHFRSSRLGFTGEHRRVNVAYSRARFINISVLSSKTVSRKDYKTGDSGKDIILRQHNYAKARNAHTEIKAEDTVFCQRCFGKPPKDKCTNDVYCPHCRPWSERASRPADKEAAAKRESRKRGHGGDDDDEAGPSSSKGKGKAKA
ncbi:hypothetical protein PG994_013219 [Apiospora phragmitis]|uniref:DNA2/NAM7 helicase-like C-terminal domain-containing protein n=1 Tax=Apiospora phragmitis TaxID=2905665 RepID=A0ABR1T811_9PEZI